MIMPTWALCAVGGVFICYALGSYGKIKLAWLIPFLFSLFALYALYILVPVGIRWSVRLAVWIPPILQVEILYFAHFRKLVLKRRNHHET